MKTAKIGIEEKSTETLKLELGELEGQIADGTITFKNSKGERKECPYGAFTHTGRIAITREEDQETFNQAFAVISKIDHERRKSGDVVSAKATHSMKLSTASVTVRTAGMATNKADVTCQLAAAQKLAGKVREIRAELERRANADRLRAEIEAKNKADAETLASLIGTRELHVV